MYIFLNFLIPDFVPVPNRDVMQMISIGSLVVGIVLLVVGIILYLVLRKKEKSLIPAWIFMALGVVLMLNHAVQLLIK